MTKIKLFMMLALLMVGVMTSVEVKAQVQWKGHDYNDLVSSSGTEVFLYNVGTGRFLIHGGDWGTQARLFSNNSGKMLTLKYGANGDNIIFDTGMTTQHNGQYANNLGCNVPNVTSSDTWGNSESCFTVIMDSKERIADGSASGTYRNWHFKRVTGTDDDVFTYYMYETLSGTDYYMGAVYGNNSNSHGGDPNGVLVLLSSSYDKATWTTAVPETDTKYNCGLKNAEKAYLGDITSIDRSMNDEVRIYGGVDIELNKLYQWRIVTKDELLALVAQNVHDTGSGLAVNLTYLIDDRGFERNDFAFFDGNYGWKAGTFTDDDIYSTDGEGRHHYTWGFIDGATSTSTLKSNIAFTSNYYNQTWNASGGTDGIRYSETPVNVDAQNYKYPVRLKASFNDISDAKYGFMEFEGVGTSYTYIDVPDGGAGVYKISCYGFWQGDNKGYLFATTKNPTTLSIADMKKEAIAELYPTSGLSKNSEANVKTAGEVFAPAQSDYAREVEVSVRPGDKIYFGVCKFDATPSTSPDATVSGTTTYFYYLQTSDGHYLKVTDNSTVEVTTNINEAQRWTTVDSFDGISYTSGNTTYYLKRNGNTPYVTTSYSGTDAYYSSSYGIYTGSGSSRYYLKLSNNSATFATGNNGTRFTRSSQQSETTGGTSYYHDTDWVGADQFQISYLGTDPVMFDEDEESLEYLMDNGNDKQYTNQSVRLHREFVKGDWNTFVFPLNLSADQIRNGFGDETLLAELVDLGLYTRRADCIDFNIVPLPSEGTAVTGGKLYLIKPENDPKETSDGVTYYDLGRQSFNTHDFEGVETVHYGVADGDDIEYRDENRNGVTTFACYYRTSGYENISGNIISNPSSISNGVYVPKHSYVIGQDTQHNGAKMYWTANNLKVKGFRGWLVDGDKTGSSNGAKFYLGGIFDNGETTGIGFIPVSDKPSTAGSNAVYDLSGRKVGTADDTYRLPKGLYIVNGKKYIVK